MDGEKAKDKEKDKKKEKDKEKDGWRDGWKRRRIRRRGEGEVGWMVKEKNNESVHMVGRMDR